MGALPQWYPTWSPIFSLSPHPNCSTPTNACPGQDTHTLSLSLSSACPATASDASSFPGTQCSELVRAGQSLQALSHLPAHPRNLLGLSPGPGPELAPVASAPEAPQLLLQTSQVQGDDSTIETRPEEVDLQEESAKPSGSFPHLAHIQVLLQIIGVIQLQDLPE